VRFLFLKNGSSGSPMPGLFDLNDMKMGADLMWRRLESCKVNFGRWRTGD
jgi:hypothetical protein